jgi:hypothetical protein
VAKPRSATTPKPAGSCPRPATTAAASTARCACSGGVVRTKWVSRARSGSFHDAPVTVSTTVRTDDVGHTASQRGPSQRALPSAASSASVGSSASTRAW